jgi:hypothetical protein
VPKAKCPSCATIVTYAAGYDPICPQCGFRGAAPVVPPPAPATWSHVPAPGTPAYAQGTPQAPLAPAQQGRQQGMAVGALVCGLVAPFVPPAGLAAIILGGLALSQADRDPQRYGGKGMAVAGLVLGILFFLFWLSMFGTMSMWDDDWMWDW